jgi:hypothetical protein
VPLSECASGHLPHKGEGTGDEVLTQAFLSYAESEILDHHPQRLPVERLQCLTLQGDQRHQSLPSTQTGL